MIIIIWMKTLYTLSHDIILRILADGMFPGNIPNVPQEYSPGRRFGDARLCSSLSARRVHALDNRALRNRVVHSRPADSLALTKVKRTFETALPLSRQLCY